MDFPTRLGALRAERGLSQEELASRCGVHTSQLGRYESGINQPTLEVLRNLCIALGVSADQLLFEDDERGSPGLVHIADAAGVLDEVEQLVAAKVIDALIYKHQAEARRSTRAKPGRKPQTAKKATPRKAAPKKRTR
jgi:transcriptional regulator with XRE-family HTH domain